MLKYLLWIILSTLTLSAHGQSSGWETDFNVKINAKSAGINHSSWLEIQRRDRWNQMNDHFLDHWQFEWGNTTKYKLFKYGIGYRYINKNQLVEHRPHLFLTPQLRMLNDKMMVSISNKLEYRIRDNNEDGFVYKIKPAVSYLVYQTPYVSVLPVVSNEMGYSYIEGGWVENKLKAGLNFVYDNSYELMPFFLYNHNIDKGTKNDSRFGLQGKVTF